MSDQLQSFVNFVRDLPVIGALLDRRPKVAVLRFSGVIADAAVRKQGISHNRYAKAIEKAFGKKGIKALALIINSPGGSAAQTALISNQIRRLAEDKEVPVFAFVEDVAASGGYWLACAADEIYAQEVSIVGSVGVISAGFGFEDFIEQHGVHRRIYTSGTEKSFLDPFRPEKKEDVARLDEVLKDIHGSFRDWIRERRREKLKGADKALFEGRFWTAGPALEKGLIDGIGDMRSVMQEKYGEDIRFADLTPEKKFPLPFPFGAQGGALAADDILDALETRALWGRYGL